MAKAVILKPIVWNDNNYKKPSESLKSKRFIGRNKGSYPTYHGFAHEEWNNDNNRVWQGYKLFHTEHTIRLLDYASEGELAIVMIASNQGNQYAVGIACNVFYNSKEEREIISKDLNIYNIGGQLWNLNSVKFCFSGKLQRFLKEWKNDHMWIAWKCPPEYFYWFKKPILLDPQKLTGKNRLITEYGRWQGIRREDVLAIIDKRIPRNHRIREWLTTGEFDPAILPKEMKVKSLKSSSFLQKKYRGSGSNRPTDKSYQYWVEGIITAEPLHAPLQAEFVNFLKKEGSMEIIQNQNYIDVQYKRENDDIVYAEIKPTKNIESNYAIRIELGQLLEYQFNLNKSAKLEIVISNKPKDNEIGFLKHLGVILTYYDKNSNKFIRFEL